MDTGDTPPIALLERTLQPFHSATFPPGNFVPEEQPTQPHEDRAEPQLGDISTAAVVPPGSILPAEAPTAAPLPIGPDEPQDGEPDVILSARVIRRVDDGEVVEFPVELDHVFESTER